MEAVAAGKSLDEQLRQLVRQSRRLLWSVIAALAVISLSAIVVLAVLLIQAEQRIGATCTFHGDLSAAPLTNNPATGRPSKLSVTIVADSWNAYHKLGCTGPVVPPSASLRHWAAVYGIPLAR